MCLSRLRDLWSSYFNSTGITTFEQLADTMVAEQLLNVLAPNVKEFVLGKRPETSEQIAAEADLSFQCSKVNEYAPQRFDNTGYKSRVESFHTTIGFYRPNSLYRKELSVGGAYSAVCTFSRSDDELDETNGQPQSVMNIKKAVV